jgi:hypothetical protein
MSGSADAISTKAVIAAAEPQLLVADMASYPWVVPYKNQG